MTTTQLDRKISEEERLNELYNYKILDTGPDEALDELTEIASALCGTNISLISLIDHDRQYFKSRKGLNVTETPRNISFCTHAIQEPDELFIVNDAKADLRFKDNPLVTSNPHIRFYAGAPLISKNGYALGTLCVIDQQPSHLNESQKKALKKLAKQASRILEFHKQERYLRESRIQINEQSKLIKEIVFTLAHDLKSPITSTSSLLEILKEDYKKTLDEKALQYINYALQSNHKVLHLIEETLEFAKTGVDENSFTSINTEECVKSAIQLYKSEIQKNKVDIKFENLPTVESIEIPLNIVFRNLISNAIKYRHPNRDLIINITAEQLDNYWKFNVIDNGIGIDKKNFEHIFKLFRRLHNDDKGIGMGLALCKKIVLSLGGKIWVKSTIDKGSQFSFTIPKI
ncbi:MAG: sensor histidine kinase [Psychroflexus salarius]